MSTKLYRYKLVIWGASRGRSEQIVLEPSYGIAYNLYLACLPPAYIGTLEPLDYD